MLGRLVLMQTYSAKQKLQMNKACLLILLNKTSQARWCANCTSKAFAGPVCHNCKCKPLNDESQKAPVTDTDVIWTNSELVSICVYLGGHNTLITPKPEIPVNTQLRADKVGLRSCKRLRKSHRRSDSGHRKEETL